MNQKQTKLSKGFTLIELIVVMAVFLFIIGAALGIFISIVTNQRKILSETQLQNQVSYVEEYMSKALRTAAADSAVTDPVSDGNCVPHGYIYLLTRYTASGQNPGFFNGIKFINQSTSICEEFFWDTSTTPYVLKELKNSNNDADAVALTSSSLQINSVKFSINGSNGSTFSSTSCPTTAQCGASTGDTLQQPRVTILLSVSVRGDSQHQIIQTTVSQRDLNVQ
jgi:prepilin-type N-terminal cleavage/methylation domain-containing protein